MELPCSSKGKGVECWPSPRAQMDSLASLDGGMRNLVSEDPLNFISEDLFNFISGESVSTNIWRNSPTATSYSSLQALNFGDQNTAAFPVTVSDGGAIFNAAGTCFDCGDQLVFQRADGRFGYPLDSADGDGWSTAKPSNGYFQQNNIFNIGNCKISWPLRRPFAERMLEALSVLKYVRGGGILVQVWVPNEYHNQDISSTREQAQPRLPDGKLAGLEPTKNEVIPTIPEISRASALAVEGDSSFLSGLTDHVVCSIVPEWTLHVPHYNQDEHADRHTVYKSTVLPVFDPSERTSFAVLEIVAVKERSNSESEIDVLCHAFQAVNLWTTAPSPLHRESLSKNRKAALVEIIDVLSTVCDAHRLPLALTWVPCTYSQGDGDELIVERVGEGNTSPEKKYILCIEDMACYVNDGRMKRFVDVCLEHYLKEGQGIAGKALQTNRPFFSPDVKAYDVNEYPLVHHARKFGLGAAVAIRLKSTYTGDDDYILEFFLPVNMKGDFEQQILLSDLSGTMLRICRSLKTVSDEELVGAEGSGVGLQGEASQLNFPPMAIPRKSSQTTLLDSDLHSVEQGMGPRDNCVHDQLQSCRRLEFQYGNDDSSKFNVSIEDESEDELSECIVTMNDDKGIDLIHSRIQKEMIPEIGMEFETEEAAYSFYNEYACKVGFSIRRSKSHKDRNGKMMDRTFCCSCEGMRGIDKRDVNVKLHRSETRFGCLAKMKVNCRQTGKYRVIKFVAGHTHEMSSTPSKTYLFRSHRNMTLARADAANISRNIAPKATFESMGRYSKKFCRLLTQLATRAAESEEKCKFIISSLGGLLEEVDAHAIDNKVKSTHVISHVNESVPALDGSIHVDGDGSKINAIKTKGRIGGESSRPKSILERAIKKNKPRNKALPPPSDDCRRVPIKQAVLPPTIVQNLVSQSLQFTQPLDTNSCNLSMADSVEPNTLPPLSHFTQP